MPKIVKRKSKSEKERDRERERKREREGARTKPQTCEPQSPREASWCRR